MAPAIKPGRLDHQDTKSTKNQGFALVPSVSLWLLLGLPD